MIEDPVVNSLYFYSRLIVMFRDDMVEKVVWKPDMAYVYLKNGETLAVDNDETLEESNDALAELAYDKLLQLLA